MKKTTKIAWILAAICLILGLGFILAGMVLGGNFMEANITPQKFLVKGQTIFFHEEEDAKEYSKLGNTITEYEGIKGLDLEFGAEEVHLEVLDQITGIRVQVKNGSIDDIKIKQTNEKLEMKSNKHKSNRIIYIYYPESYKFETVDLEIGAGEVKIEQLDAQEIEFKCGVGELQASLAGTHTDYNYEAECGIGEIVIGDDKYSGIAGEGQKKYEDAHRELSLECGIGNIKISFEE